jgi:hypothetical protein
MRLLLRPSAHGKKACDLILSVQGPIYRLELWLEQGCKKNANPIEGRERDWRPSLGMERCDCAGVQDQSQNFPPVIAFPEENI